MSERQLLSFFIEVAEAVSAAQDATDSMRIADETEDEFDCDVACNGCTKAGMALQDVSLHAQRLSSNYRRYGTRYQKQVT